MVKGSVFQSQNWQLRGTKGISIVLKQEYFNVSKYQLMIHFTEFNIIWLILEITLTEDDQLNDN